jgi:hypothetical protein
VAELSMIIKMVAWVWGRERSREAEKRSRLKGDKPDDQDQK